MSTNMSKEHCFVLQDKIHDFQGKRKFLIVHYNSDVVRDLFIDLAI